MIEADNGSRVNSMTFSLVYDWGRVRFNPQTIDKNVSIFVSEFIRNPVRRTSMAEPLPVITRVVPAQNIPENLGLPHRRFVLVLDPFASNQLLRQGWRRCDDFKAFIGYSPEQIEATGDQPFNIVVSPVDEHQLFAPSWDMVFRIANAVSPDLAGHIQHHGSIIAQVPYNELINFGERVIFTRKKLDETVGCNYLFTGQGVVAQPESRLTVSQEYFTQNKPLDSLTKSAVIQFHP